MRFARLARMTEAVPGPSAFPHDVDIAIVSHNGRETLPRVLECLTRAGAPDDRIVVYDIGSTDGTAGWLAASWPRVVLHRLPDNVGPNPARNLALQRARRPALLLLDSDAFVRPDVPSRLRAALDPAARVGTVAPIVVYAHAPDRIQYAGVNLHFLCEAVNPWMDRPLVERGLECHTIGSAAGVALLIDVAAARAVGWWDERYFMGKDDGDFCYRLRLAGYRLVEDGHAVVEHGGRPRSAWMFRYQIRNRWYFMLKNYGTRSLVVLAPAWCIHEVLQLALLVATGHLKAWWQAVSDLASWRSGIGASRRAVQATRTIPDRDLLVCAPLVVRQDLVGGGPGRLMKRAYDAWLRGYWSVARHLL
jgi:GT2 family glycosyltransferase